MSLTKPKFVYFDLGNVLLFFDHALACHQMSQVTGISAPQIREFFAQSPVIEQLETGSRTVESVHADFCRTFQVSVDLPRLSAAACDMFTVNRTILPLVARLWDAGIPLGILSNTSPPHWEWVGQGRFRFIRDLFQVYALSFQLRAMKPSPAIYAAATRLAGVPASEIFFTDDREENVRGAQAAGWQAVPFHSASQLAAELHRSGLQFFF